MPGLIQTALWPFPQEDYPPAQRLLRSVGKRLTACAAALDESYRVPSPAELSLAHGGYDQMARTYFEHPFRNPLWECMKRSISGGASLTDYFCLHRYVRRHKPRRILELGCGISSCILANALAENAVENPVGAGHLHSMEHLEMYFADVQKVIPDNLKAFVTFHLSPAEIFHWRGTVPTSCYQQLPEEPYELLFVDGPPAEGRSNGDMFRVMGRLRQPVDILIDKRVKTAMTLDRYLPKGTVWFDYSQELGFARGVTAAMLAAEPRMTMPMRHKDVFAHFDLVDSASQKAAQPPPRPQPAA